MKSEVFNNAMGSEYIFDFPQLSQIEEQTILANIFEQLLIFDSIVFSTSRLNFALTFLISKLGMATVERLLNSGYIKFLLWTPVIITTVGRRGANNQMDDSSIYGQPPITAGELSSKDADPEKNIYTALDRFNIGTKAKREFAQKAAKKYIIPRGMEFSTGSAALVIDSYRNNGFADLGLPFEKEPDQLNVSERGILLDLGNKVLETAILSNHSLKSFENYEPYVLCHKNLENIGKAYNVADNTSQLLHLNNLPDLKELYLTGKLDFDTVFKIRHLGTAKYYRKWINEVGENSDVREITKSYYDEIEGRFKFFERPAGKIVRSLAIFGIGKALETIVNGPVEAAADITLGLLDNLVLDGLLKGRKPSMFINEIQKQINRKASSL